MENKIIYLRIITVGIFIAFSFTSQKSIKVFNKKYFLEYLNFNCCYFNNSKKKANCHVWN